MRRLTTTVVAIITLFVLAAAPGCRREGASAAEHAAEGPENRLAKETSPYLLLHAHNPVDWYPWGEEAFAKAKAEGKLVFLSIGYSSCYWCHVMERESFSDAEIAKLLNEHFVCIKVDREERPDVDEIYMTALQLYMQAIGSPQGGGWPLSMFLTPDAKPIMGGTYFPVEPKHGLVAFGTLLGRLHKAWADEREKLQQSADQLATVVDKQLRGQTPDEPPKLDARLVDGVLHVLAAQFDSQQGGFGYSAITPRYPKFPEPSNLALLLQRAEHEREQDKPDDRAEAMLVFTLEKMAAGGMRDHLGGGFHRYSTDRFWAIPHFEKMLYDNAQLASIYAEAYRLTGREDFRRIVDEILEFVLREMTAPQGGFYSAIDAETDAEEGRYYVWQRDELTEALDPQQFELLADVYGIGERGNFEGRHVLLLPRPIEQTARNRNKTAEELHRELLPVSKKLLAVRDRRERPLTDTKVLTAWNGLMIRAFADAGRILEEPRYVQAAEKAARFVLENLRTAEGRLLRTFSGSQAKLNAYLDDYAFLVDGLIALNRATGERQWLDEADRLTAMQIELFWDDAGGGFFFTSDDHETLIARSKDPADSALPSGNAVAAGNLVTLAAALERPSYLARAEEALQAFSPLLQQAPSSVPRMAVALAALLDGRKADL